MNPEEYRLMRRHEDGHWWYRALRSAVVRHLGKRCGGGRPRLLDAGCGTGGMLASLRAGLPAAELVGVDLDAQAVDLTRERGVAAAVVRGSLNALPFAAASFDAVVSLDVLVHADVDEAAALGELGRVLRPGAPLVLNLAAFDSLRGAHDVAVHGVRRYTPRRLFDLAARHGLRVEHWTCWNAALFPAVWAWRTVGRLTGSGASDLRPPSAWANRAFGALVAGEWRIADRVSLPFGSSLFAVLRKPAAA